MTNIGIRAAFYRGGTSKAILFNAADLPKDKKIRDRIFLYAMGSPDVYGRQLNGMGGGLSSLSKIVIVEPSSRDDADVDYTFIQISVDEPVADYGGMCGNMSSAVGPFAIDEGMVVAKDGMSTVRVYNTNTNKIFHANFEVVDGAAVEQGDFSIPGVSGSGAKISLDFINPGGAVTGQLLPSGKVYDKLQIDGMGVIKVSLVDASNPIVFVRAQDVGIKGIETPAELDRDTALMERLEIIRRSASVAMGMSATTEEAILSNPKIAIISPSQSFDALGGTAYDKDEFDLSVRLVSMGNFHRAITLTGAMCLAVAARIKGTLVNDLVTSASDVRIGNPSGVLSVQADVEMNETGPFARSVTTFRTQRRIMDGRILFPSSFL
ncbi:MAG: PrpF family protein [Hyphomicrobiales bacterium]|nr:MAG: PrpF family protein [Hyphomicrobiales bacterium]